METSFILLWEQLPDYFKPISPFEEILKAQGWGIDQLQAFLGTMWSNLYIPTCDEETIAYWEHLLDITYRFGDTLEYRRQRVIQKFNTHVPFSIEFLKNRLTDMFGDEYEMTVNPVECTMNVKVTSSRYGAVKMLWELLLDVVPAHIQIIANQEVINYIGGANYYFAGFTASTKVQTIGG